MAQLLAGLQVPRSMGILGTATEAYDKLRDMYHCIGWLDVEEHERRIEQHYRGETE